MLKVNLKTEFSWRCSLGTSMFRGIWYASIKGISQIGNQSSKLVSVLVFGGLEITEIFPLVFPVVQFILPSNRNLCLLLNQDTQK